LDSRHTFSFADYFDRQHMNFGPLRVINEDIIAPGAGFPLHPHRDMEIITYVLSGALEHADSMGNGSVIQAGDVQRMSAGTGVTHSERNPSTSEPVHLLQIWIMPRAQSLPPSYEQKQVPPSGRDGQLALIAASDVAAATGAVTLHQDAHIYTATLAPGQAIEHMLEGGHKVWLQVTRGSVRVLGEELQTGDGAGVTDETVVQVAALTPASILLFDFG